MHLDVLDLRNFYYRSALGRQAQTVIREQLLTFWPEAKGQSVAGFGFAVPLLRPYLKDARRVIGLMPGPQGVMPWPRHQPNISVLCEETLWPIPTGLIDKLVVLHGLETSENPSVLLDECFRVLGPGGRAVFIVPNRAGLWSRSDNTPFGYGRPYTMGQLDIQMRKHRFVTEQALSTLYQPPTHKRGWRRAAKVMERLGRNLPLLAPGGVLMIEVSKQMATPRPNGLRDTAPRRVGVIKGLAAPTTDIATR